MHAGHRALLGAARAWADAHGARLAAAVFEPHPRQVLQPDAPPFRLQNGAQRACALEAAGVDDVFEIRFDRDLSQLSDSEFAEQILHRRLGAAHVTVGAQFRFGRGRGGDVNSLKVSGERLGFSVEAIAEIATPTGGAKISSTAIRQAIARGEMAEAQQMLGRPWAIEGVVRHGAARGRELGFATANVGLGAYQRPKLGIYAVRVDIGEGDMRAGVASIGVNPTFGALSEPVLEAHLFDFDRDLYGRTIEVELVGFMRAEEKFESAEALARQIAEDVAQARALLTLP